MDDPAVNVPPAIISPYPAPPAVLEPPKPWGFWATVGLTLVIALGYLLAQGIGVLGFLGWSVATGLKFPGPKELESNGLMLSLATVFSTPAGVGFPVLFAWLRKGITVREYLGLHWPAIGKTIKWCAGFLIFLLAGDLLTTLMKLPISPDFMVNVYQNPGFLPLLWLAVIVAAPVGEEFIFRGFLFAGLRRSRLGGLGAVLLSSAPWAAIHLQYDVYGISMIFITGIFLGMVRLKTGSLFLCILLHGLMNLYSTVEVAYLTAS